MQRALVVASRRPQLGLRNGRLGADQTDGQMDRPRFRLMCRGSARDGGSLGEKEPGTRRAWARLGQTGARWRCRLARTTSWCRWHVGAAMQRALVVASRRPQLGLRNGRLVADQTDGQMDRPRFRLIFAAARAAGAHLGPWKRRRVWARLWQTSARLWQTRETSWRRWRRRDLRCGDCRCGGGASAAPSRAGLASSGAGWARGRADWVRWRRMCGSCSTSSGVRASCGLAAGGEVDCAG
jgi:hypothetical protein